MENKELNLVEILKDCPKGTELYSPAYGYIILADVRADKYWSIAGIQVKDGEDVLFDTEGKMWDSEDAECMLFPSKDNRDWSTFKVEKPKWNPDTLQPFDKVLVRDSDREYWGGDFYLYTDKETGSEYINSCVDSNYKICIPYNEETKHLLGTNQEAPEYYRQ